MFKENFISMIFAAGGIGSRMESPVPKQFLPLGGKTIALHSFELFSGMEAIDEIVVVCAPQFQSQFYTTKKPVCFASPGTRRQDSIYNGLKAANPKAKILCTHDVARPFIDQETVSRLLEKALEIGAATLAAPVVYTIKQSCANGHVKQTLDRSNLWEIQTPQAMRRDLFERGFSLVAELKSTVTDDVSLAELLAEPVAIVPSKRSNLKITTPTDLAIAKVLFEQATNPKIF